MTISDNHIPGAIYFDTSVQYEFAKGIQAFVVVENLGNTDPVQIGYGTSVGGGNLSVNPALYDIVGRTFRVGSASRCDRAWAALQRQKSI